MLDKDCQEIFGIADCINELAERADNGSVSAVPVGLYAVGYYLAGIAANIANATLPVASYLDRKRAKTTGSAKTYKPLIRKAMECQEVITYFADAVHRDCCNPTIHVSSQIISSAGESAAEKVAILKELGVTICPTPAAMGDTVAKVLANL